MSVRSNSVARNVAAGSTAAISSGVGDNYELQHNTIAGNACNQGEPAVFVAPNAHPLFNFNNLFQNSGAYELMNWNDVGTPDVNAESNWWGTRVEGEIQQKIYDWYDDATKGIVDYTPWDTVIRTDCPVSPPTGVQAQAIGDTLVLVTWNANPEPDLEGYIVHWDTTNDTLYPFAHHVDVGRTTTYAIRGLTPDTYFITVTAYDADYDSTRNLPNTVINECQTDGNESWYAEGVYVYVTGVGEAAVVIPRELGLVCVGSNPFRRGTTIRYALPARTQVDLAVYDLSGRKVACLAQGEKQPGRYEARFDASKLPAGVYFCRLEAGSETRTKKLVVGR
jgi:hypothetical protein